MLIKSSYAGSEKLGEVWINPKADCYYFVLHRLLKVYQEHLTFP